MGQTIAQKVLARASGRTSVRVGEFVWAEPDLVIAHDLNYPRYRQMMTEAGYAHVAQPEKLLLTIDHTTHARDEAALKSHAFMRADALREKVSAFFDHGRHGISHNVPLDADRVQPGMLVLSSDTRGPALGCAGALSIAIGIGLLTVLARGKAWLRVPETIRVELTGTPRPWVMSRDIAQWVANRIGFEKGDYRCIEFHGDFVAQLDIDGRHTLCNAMVDLGVKAAVCAVPNADALRTDASLASRWIAADPGAPYVEVLELDVASIGPQVSVPPDPENVVPLPEVVDRPITHAFVGSCIGGKMEDLRAAARVLRGRTVAPGVRLVVIPATQQIYRRALAEGLIDDFANAGAVITAGICGPCYGTFAPLGDGDVSIGTPTRNDPGRMGSEQATIYIANAAVVAASAAAGRIADPAALTETVQ